ncbi:rho guanine nucleotide exchange factor TIAM2 isoform X1 [Ictalurus furcatus]|uniref:rho guanine nucleotide exchange factor TIAM2 isoform X1 n=1 Tax=Ictalurus furcatus TaxID=66913 RepID=UPI00235045CA|nr:rho guanine nucleotide exchange factor TIAM2 isoform X1 [Ictalurus furcatus]XP_053488306.1 rho guanine nucleotide exchange factor TIAM2 isoform X1 [Ictalurus furcatus]XP_053488308.1 rho guanine nucleotide exchange factor TIAM2 isoform X1 [Ictalurus furcatus]XP_053488309.1 rho guanine nucleotide exchange factor TIAM2 isoform X1 [Ictalurus furcatus]XP_053488310.1 rho guanine nucleotide exchange factor TIAM2 isoform X1 [Ictalurus furcatus]
MGNSESQYSIQGSRSSSFTLPNRQKSYSVKLRSSKEGSRGPGYKSKTVSRGCLSQHKACGQSSMSRHYDYVAKGREAKRRISAQWSGSPRGRAMSENGRVEENGRVCNGHAVNGYKTPERKIEPEELEDQSSPRVMIKSDGSVRVEFSQMSKNSTLPGENGGPVQLLKFSPTSQSVPAPDRDAGLAANGSITRMSKRGSLSSEGSWYDSPWVPGAELNDVGIGVGVGASPNRISETLPSVRIEYCDDQLPPLHLYRDPGTAASFPAAKHLTLANELSFKHRSSFVCVMEEPVLDESSGARQYSSFTLPCPKPKPIAENAGTKEPVRNRMRRLSDWTGSLTRRKKKSKEPRYKEPVDCFDSGVDGLTADTSSPSQVSSLLGYPKVPSRGRSQSQVLPSCGGSFGALHPGTDALRQNIYDNFMRELETSHTAAGSGEERGENSAEDTESSSQETVGSLEQLDLLCEKEQGVVRRAGWLTFKPLLTLHKDRKLELVARRKWKQYWVTLKGCTLLFYETYGKGSPEQETLPSYALLAEDGIVQAVPEHPKKENVFCLSNAYGDVYLFQATSQTDLENWVTAIHSASASLVAKRHGKEDTLLLLRGQIRSLLQKIDMDGKMKKMAELQLSIVTDPKNRKAIENQIQQWDQNLERFNIDLFRMRCYLASLQGGELPNPKSLLATASRPSKAALGRLGIFSVSSFHALICSRDEATLRKRSLSLSQRSRSRRGVFSSLKGLDSLTKRSREKRPCASQVFDSAAGEHLGSVPPYSRERLDALADGYSLAPPDGSQWDGGGVAEKPVWVYMPDYQAVTVALSEQHTVTELLNTACKARNLDPSVHCLRLRRCLDDQTEIWTPAPHELLQDLLYDELEVSALSVYTLHMTKHTCTGDFGFAVTGHVDGLSHSRIFVTEVLSDGIAFGEGLRPGDEILVLNGCQVSSLDLSLIQTLFSENTLHLTVRREPTALTHAPLTHTRSSLQPARDFLYRHHRAKSATDVSCVSEASGNADVETKRHHRQSLRAAQHSKSVETVCTLYHSFQDASGGLMEVQKETAGADGALTRPCPRHMSVTERLRKVIQELVDTEKSYVKDLSCLFEIYLTPLQKETFLTLDEMESLFGSLPEMLDFQKVFLQTLEERISSTPDFSTLETPVQFKKLLFSLGGSFLYYADHFKLYSGFCANHIKVQKVLERAKTDRAFKEFLDARNPTKQHSSTLESYLIKPVQRVLKYPLLLRELVSLTDTDSEEHYHLTEALKAMEKVASHINEMQKIYEDYGAVFDQLVVEQSGSEKEVTEISMGEFLMHSSVMWLNPLPSLGRMKKEPELTVFVFKKAVILVCRESNKLKKKMNVPRSAHSHGEQDPFKFRWLVPRSALQVRLGNTAESSCVWELIHTKSELEGRPETVFQLCSSTPESKVNTVKVIRAVLRENARKGMRGTERPAERTCKEHLVPLRGNLPSSAKLGSSRASWMCQKPISDSLKLVHLDTDSASESSGDPPPAPPTNSTLRHSSVRESDILGDNDDGFSERLARRDSTPGSIETRFHELCLSDGAREDPEGREVNSPETQPQLRRAHFSAVRRRSARSEPRRSPAALLNLRRNSHSLDNPSESAVVSVDLNALLERDFSVQSLTSVINEDCFYEKGTTATPS